MSHRTFFIGTSGWHYKHWLGRYYPADMKPDKFLSFYLKDFDTVELNNPFYHLPLPQTFRNWYAATPKDFRFSIKASRYITHMKRLIDPEETTPRFFEVVGELKDKAGPILFQLPPRWRSNPERLEKFLKRLPNEFRYTFELRDPSWFNQQIYDILARHRVAFCIYDFDFRQSPTIVTTDFVYIRLHGPEGKYRGQYTDKALNDWAAAFEKWKAERKKVYCYFDNDDSAYAVYDAQRLKKMVRQ